MRYSLVTISLFLFKQSRSLTKSLAWSKLVISWQRCMFKLIRWLMWSTQSSKIHLRCLYSKVQVCWKYHNPSYSKSLRHCSKTSRLCTSKALVTSTLKTSRSSVCSNSKSLSWSSPRWKEHKVSQHQLAPMTPKVNLRPTSVLTLFCTLK